MPKSLEWPWLTFAVALLCLLPACKSMHTIEDLNDPAKIVEQIEIGDQVRITTKKGEKKKFSVVSISNEQIAGKNVEVSMEDISQIRVRKTDPQKTAGVAAGSVAGGTVVVAAVASIILALLIAVLTGF